METMITHQSTFLILAVLTLLCGFAVVPYTLTGYNTRHMPRWICPTRGYLNRTYQYYYPAQRASCYSTVP